MSFIFDDRELLNSLINIAMPPVVKKEAQQTAPDPAMVKSVATKLISKLDQASGAITAGTQDAALYMKDLQDLDSLLAFLRLEGMQYNAKKIVVDNYDKLEATDKALYVPYKTQTAGLDMAVGMRNVGVYKDGLINYLKMLQKTAQDTGGPQEKLTNALISKLIESANTTLQLGVSKDQLKDGGRAADTVADNTPLDSVYDSLIFESPLLPQRNKGNITIIVSDLKSKGSFDAFVRKISLKKNNKIIAYDDFTDANYCDVIYVLYTRASSYAYRAGDPVSKAYLQLMTELAGQYQCSLGDIAKSSPSNTQVSYRGVSEEKLSGRDLQLAHSIAMKMPLLGDRIDFPRIATWLDDFSHINKDQIVASNIESAQQELSDIQTTYRITAQPLSQEATAIIQTIMTTKPGSVEQKTNAPSAYLHQLQQLMSLVGTVLGAFKNKVYDGMPEDAKNEIDQQIGGGGSSIYAVNIEKIELWLNDLSNAFQTMRTRGF